MLEIPGEEAPTDPGLQLRLKKKQEEQLALEKKKKKSRILGVVALVALLGVAGAGTAVWQDQQEALTYEMDDYYATPLSELEAAAPVPVASADTPVGTPATGTRPSAKRPATEAPTIGVGTPVGDMSVRPRPPSEPGVDQLAPAVGSALGDGGGVRADQIKVSFAASDRVLSDDDEIFAMAKAVINASSPQLQGCYNQRLKQVEGLKGAWEVSFTVAKDGTSKNVRVTGANGSDRDLEGCMTRAVLSWKFQKIIKDQPVKKTYRFGAGSW